MEFGDKERRSQYYLACREKLKDIKKTRELYLSMMVLGRMIGIDKTQSAWEEGLKRIMVDANELQVKIINLEKNLDLRGK